VNLRRKAFMTAEDRASEDGAATPGAATAVDRLEVLLSDSARAGGCPACHVIARLLYEEMSRLPYATSTDEGALDALVREGLCGDHLWYLFDLAGGEAIAGVLRALALAAAGRAADVGERLARDPGVLRGGAATIARLLVPAGCVACRSVRAWDDAIVRAAVAGPAAIPGDRLCVLHLAAVLAASPASDAALLAGRWGEALEALAGRLAVVTARRASNDRALGPERYAPTDAVRRLAGGRGGGRAPR
jgi:hypothetical protein